MRKLALLLGSLVVVASASAKEVVPAPVVVEEAPVQIVEKEVIVYKEKEEGFRPNGNIDLQYRYYGKAENNREWGPSSANSSRTQLQGKIQMTENQTFDFRVRDWNSLDKEDKLGRIDTAVRLRYFYDHGTLGDSKIAATSMVRYEKNGSQALEYKYTVQLADYLFNNDFVKTTDFSVGPRYIYDWDAKNDDTYTSTIGLYANLVNEHPWGFSTQIELDGLHYNMYGDAARPVDGKADNFKDNDVSATVNVYLYHNANLYTNGKYSLDWAFEGGYDSYEWHSIDCFANKNSYDAAKYSAYALPSLTLSYQATEFVSLYATAGAEYRNWKVENESKASDWRWQPYAIVGFNVAF